MKTIPKINKVPKIPAPVRERVKPDTPTSHGVNFYTIMRDIDQYKGDRDALTEAIRFIVESRETRLVIPQLLTLLGIDPTKSKPSDFSTKELLRIVLHLYEAIVVKPPQMVGAEFMETWENLRCHLTIYHSKAAMVDGHAPGFVHTITLGYKQRGDAEDILNLLYTPDVMEAYGIKAAGYRTTTKHVQGAYQIKLWCEPTKHGIQYRELIPLLAGGEEE